MYGDKNSNEVIFLISFLQYLKYQEKEIAKIFWLVQLRNKITKMYW